MVIVIEMCPHLKIQYDWRPFKTFDTLFGTILTPSPPYVTFIYLKNFFESPILHPFMAVCFQKHQSYKRGKKFIWQFVDSPNFWVSRIIWKVLYEKKTIEPLINRIDSQVFWLITSPPLSVEACSPKTGWKSWIDIKQILPFQRKKWIEMNWNAAKQSQWTIQGQRLHTHAPANGNSSHHA